MKQSSIVLFQDCKKTYKRFVMPMSGTFKQRLFPIIPELDRHFETPFQIDHEMGIVDTHRYMVGTLSSRGVAYRNFYAVKANPIEAVQKIIADEGGGFDCSSIPEFRMAKSAGATPDSIMFTSNNTSAEEFREVSGKCILNLDDITYVERFRGKFPELISFRLNPGRRKTGKQVNKIIGDPVNSKYGVPIEKIIHAYRLAKNKGAKRFGLHTMVCSNDLNYRNMVHTQELLLEVATDLNDKLGIEVEFINMGGGIGIPYRPEDKAFEFEALADACVRNLNNFLLKNSFQPDLYTECGRYVTGPHGVLVNRVINICQKYQKFVGVQVAMPALMRHGMYGSYHHCTVLDRNGCEKDGRREKVSIVGPICENIDRLGTYLLPKIEVGDYIVTHDTGAHGIAMGFNYNGRTRPQVLMLKKNNMVVLTCKKETYSDLIRRQKGLGMPEGAYSF